MVQDLSFQWQCGENDKCHLVVSFGTTHELDEVVRLLMIVRQELSSFREAIAADFGIVEKVPTYSDQIMQLIGDPA